MKKPAISVVICTYNRAKFLEQALASLALQTLEQDKYEVLVVDNASTDNTSQVVETWKPRILDCRYVYETTLGLSYARNRGLDEASAPIVAYLDDDSIAEPQWLSALLQTYSDIVPCPVAVGGKILLKWHGTQPVWLNHTGLLQMLGLCDEGEKIIPVKHISGSNMSFQRNILLRYRGFDSRLGRKGNLQLTAEESDVQLRMREDGQILYYQPQAIVWHQIDQSKQMPNYLVRRFYAHGQSDAIRYVLHEWPGTWNLIKIMIRQVWRKLKFILRFYTAFWIGTCPPSAERYWIRCQLAELFGFEIRMLRLLFHSDVN